MRLDTMLVEHQETGAAFKKVLDVATQARSDSTYTKRMEAELWTYFQSPAAGKSREELETSKREKRIHAFLLKLAQSFEQDKSESTDPASMLRSADRLVRLRRVRVATRRVVLDPAAPAAPPAPPARHTMRCPSDNGCMGFVVFHNGEASGTCGMCACKVCTRCERLRQEASHACDDDDVESVRTLRASTKPCPWEGCGVRITRSEGCSQMWCTNCKKPFDWNTGERIEGRRTLLHNPHYFEYRRRRREEQEGGGGGAVDEEEEVEEDGAHGEGGGCCGAGRPLNYIVMSDECRDAGVADRLNNVLCNINHATAIIVAHTLGADVERRHRRAMRMNACKHLAGLMSRAELLRRAFLTEREARFVADHVDVLQAACQCATDAMRVLSRRSTKEDCEGVLGQVESLRQHFNEALCALSKRFNGRATYEISEDWRCSLARRGSKRAHEEER